MCGIFCEICYSNQTLTKDLQVYKRITNRGPNCTQSVEINLGEGMIAFFCGAVLWMQGQELIPQPVEDDLGVLLYNGDIFDDTWDSNVSDTQVIMQKLCHESGLLTEAHIINQLELLKGPFSIIFYDKANRQLYFTRDRIGRGSLLFHKSDNSIIISNVLGRDYDCVEVPATHIQILDLSKKQIKLYPWNRKLHTIEESSLDCWLTQIKKQQSLPDDEFKFDYEEEGLTDEDGIVKFIEMTARMIKCKMSLMKTLMEHETIKENVLKVTKLLEKSVELRLKRQPNKCKVCLENNADHCGHCTVGVLFSGGLDCTILALLADKYLPQDQSIDLINVAFRKDNNSSYEVPDRLTGRQSFLELQKLCPTRKWNFMEVDVPKEELELFQANTIGDLVYPRQTILDESLGTALWFAARGQDCTNSSTSRVIPEFFTRQWKVLLVGSGADELFGGYIRHRNALKRHGWQGLSKELQLDWKRISFRNLARDNRVLCDHGRQPRMPYLDENFTNYVLQLKPWLRCYPTEDMCIGVGDKLTLRLVAINLGLNDAVVLPKRALQFGSRIANKKEKGSEISKTFLKNKLVTIQY